MINEQIKKLHERNLKLFSSYLDLEGELIDSLQEFDTHHGHKKMGYRSLFHYCLEGVKMTENQAYTLIRVSRKALEVPALKEAVKKKEIPLASAKVISSVLTVENQDIWLERAKTFSKPMLEREVVKINPKAIKRDRILPLSSELSEARGAISKEALQILERVKEIESKRLSGPCDLDKAIIAMGKIYLSKKDPVEVAERIVAKKEIKIIKANPSSVGKRIHIPKAIQHQVNLRDRGQCRVIQNGKPCLSRHYPQIHHIKEVSQGGTNTLENLITLCSGHHRSLHDGVILNFFHS